MSAKITPITTAPAAFSGIVAKLNEVIAANPPLQAGKGISITDAKENRIVSIKLTADDINTALGTTFEEFTICDSGSPVSRWIMTRTTAP